MILKYCEQTIEEISSDPIKVIYSIDFCCYKMATTKHIQVYNGQKNMGIHVDNSLYTYCPHCGQRIDSKIVSHFSVNAYDRMSIIFKKEGDIPYCDEIEFCCPTRSLQIYKLRPPDKEPQYVLYARKDVCGLYVTCGGKKIPQTYCSECGRVIESGFAFDPEKE